VLFRSIGELARLTALGGDFRQAARHYARLGHPVAEAHYLVRLARENFARGDTGEGEKWVDKALKVHPGSVEAWLELMVNDCRSGAWQELGRDLQKALDRVRADLRFVLLEGLLEHAALSASRSVAGEAGRPFTFCPPQEIAEAVLPVLERQEPDLLLQYYAAWLLCGQDRAAAASWLEKTLVLSPSFWPARLELLALGMEDQNLAPAFRTQLEFFAGRAREIKRFICRACGLKREQVFFVCPRCQSWHSIAYRTTLAE